MGDILNLRKQCQNFIGTHSENIQEQICREKLK